mgnify:CR=1 FL=1
MYQSSLGTIRVKMSNDPNFCLPIDTARDDLMLRTVASSRMHGMLLLLLLAISSTNNYCSSSYLLLVYM